MKELPKAYEPAKYEDSIYDAWEQSGFFNPDACLKAGITSEKSDYFSIVLPPPNVTGTLHMGHAAMLAIEDVLIRYHRMKGERVLWVPGTDHAAVATESKVEGLLIKEEGFKKPKDELGREAFLERVKRFAKDSHDTIVNQSKKMGSSLDWSREAYTLDDVRNKAVRMVFKKMYDDGLIYRGYRVINWSVKGQSTCSDDELVYVERPAKLHYFKYSKDCPITIATTRPETKLGDTAIAVHPTGRWKKYIGQTFVISDFGEVGHALTLKVIGDEGIDDSFGTGALGVTTAHSPIDFEMYQKQKALGNDIGLIQVIGEDGLMTPAAGTTYTGLTVEEAREKVVSWLEHNGLLEKTEDIVQNVSTSDRFKDIVEPLPKVQWFVDVNKKFVLPQSHIHGIKKGQEVSLKGLMQQVVESKQVTILPDRFEKTYFHWINNLRDWCISRQIWFGHQIPVWYCLSCKNEKVNPVVRGSWYFVRHGETDWNVEKRIQGQTDNPLNETGKNQAVAAAEMLRGVAFDAIFSSDLVRAHETAKIIAAKTGGEVIADNRLREIYFGKAEAMLHTEARERYPDMWGYSGKSADNESVEEAEQRIWQVVGDHIKKPEYKNVLVVSHHGVLRALMRRIRAIDPNRHDTVPRIPNAEPIQLDILENPCEKCGGHFFEQDSDTLDTWFSSGLWTFSTLLSKDIEKYTSLEEWLQNSPDVKNFHPTSVLETGYDILFFWVARMILMTTYTLGDVPFKTVYLHGLVRDDQGRKMSKTLGNIIDPLDMIAKYGTDATRLSLLIGTAPGNDVKLSEEKIAGFRNFANKLWNISRFMLLTIPDPKSQTQEPKPVTDADAWILSGLNALVVEVRGLLNEYQFSAAGERLRSFTWDDLADFYLEAAKAEGDKAEMLNYILNTLLKLWHPFMPFVTETIWREIYGASNMLMFERFPAAETRPPEGNVVNFQSKIIPVISKIRSLRADNKIEPAKKIEVSLDVGAYSELFERNSPIIKGLWTGIETLTLVVSIEKSDGFIHGHEAGVEIYIKRDGAVDTDKEKARLEKELAEAEKYAKVLQNKLANQDFVARAPEPVIAGERAKLAAAEEKVTKTKAALENLKG